MVAEKIEGKRNIIQPQVPSLDLGNSPEFQKALSACSTDAVDRVILDMEMVETIDSSGLGVIISFWHFLRENSKELVLAGCSVGVTKTLTNTRMNESITMVSSLAEA